MVDINGYEINSAFSGGEPLKAIYSLGYKVWPTAEPEPIPSSVTTTIISTGKGYIKDVVNVPGLPEVVAIAPSEYQYVEGTNTAYAYYNDILISTTPNYTFKKKYIYQGTDYNGYQNFWALNGELYNTYYTGKDYRNRRLMGLYGGKDANIDIDNNNDVWYYDNKVYHNCKSELATGGWYSRQIVSSSYNKTHDRIDFYLKNTQFYKDDGSVMNFYGKNVWRDEATGQMYLSQDGKDYLLDGNVWHQVTFTRPSDMIEPEINAQNVYGHIGADDKKYTIYFARPNNIRQPIKAYLFYDNSSWGEIKVVNQFDFNPFGLHKWNDEYGRLIFSSYDHQLGGGSYYFSDPVFTF